MLFLTWPRSDGNAKKSKREPFCSRTQRLQGLNTLRHDTVGRAEDSLGRMDSWPLLSASAAGNASANGSAAFACYFKCGFRGSIREVDAHKERCGLKSIVGDKGSHYFNGEDALDTPSVLPLWVYLVRRWRKSGHKALPFCLSHVKRKCGECGKRFPFGLMQACSTAVKDSVLGRHHVYRRVGIDHVILEDGLVCPQSWALSCESCGMTLKSVCPSLLCGKKCKALAASKIFTSMYFETPS